MSTQNRIRIKFGEIEIEYEGNEKFNKFELLEFLTAINSKNSFEPFSSNINDRRGRTNPPSEGSVLNQDPEKCINGMTTRNITSKLDYKPGYNLVLAACAKLAIIERHYPISREEILEEMKGAQGIFTISMQKSLSRYLQNLVRDGFLNEVSAEKYSLTDTTEAKIRGKITK